MQKGGRFLCMGCNQYFPRREVELVEGVAFCAHCEEAKAEFIQNRLRAKAEKAAPQTLGYGSSADEARWESSFDTSQMISVSTAHARRLQGRIDVQGRAGFFSLILAAVIDLIPLGAFIYWRYGQNPNYQLWAPEAIGVFLGVIAYRVLFVLAMGKSIGMALAAIRPVGSDGRPVGLMGAVVHGAFFIMGRVVSEAEWKRAAARAAYYAERHAQGELKVEVAKRGPLGLTTRKEFRTAEPPIASSKTGADPWHDPDWKPPAEHTSSDPWNDPNWKPPADSGNDPWNDPSR